MSASVLRAVLAGVPTELPDDAELRARLEELGLAGLAWSEGGGPARAPLRAAALSTGLLTALRLEALDRARQVLEGVGITGVPLRGAALVRAGVYPDTPLGRCARPMTDVDLLIPVDRVASGWTALVEAGFRPWRMGPAPETGWLDAATLEFGPPNRSITLDLHWRVSRGGLRFGVPGLEKELGAGALPEPAAHFVHIAEHLLRHLRVELHVLGFADLVRAARIVPEWERVVRLAASGPLAPGVAALLEAVRVGLGAPIPAGVPERIARSSGARLDRATVQGLDPAGLLGEAPPGRLAGLRLRWRWSGGGLRALRTHLPLAFPPGRWLAARWPGTPAPLRLPRLWAEAIAWGLGRGVSPVSGNQEFEPHPTPTPRR